MAFYTIQTGSSEERNQVRNWLTGLERMSYDSQEKMITAWISSWKSSSFSSLEQIPGFTFSFYKLTDHVNDVVHFGTMLAEQAIKRWDVSIDWETLLQVFILHDIDKPLLLATREDRIEKTDLASQIQHGVLGALLLKEMGFSEKVISIVATHSTNSPFHGSSNEAYILHYADMFAADHALMIDGKSPFYQKMSIKK
ncbi:HDIG domain-containing metalloprotein [Ammoniphilus sp. 3BR4]|uniref:HDIG domain-containing metalloprotein n=1 Tax=Ammoniphilus sp. 3BR4 TaxID=3158265 RepID=UPI00346594F4